MNNDTTSDVEILNLILLGIQKDINFMKGDISAVRGHLQNMAISTWYFNTLLLTVVIMVGLIVVYLIVKIAVGLMMKDER